MPRRSAVKRNDDSSVQSGVDQEDVTTALAEALVCRYAGMLDLEGATLTAFDSGDPSSCMVISTGFDCTVSLATISPVARPDEIFGLLITIEPETSMMDMLRATSLGDELPPTWMLQGIEGAIPAPFDAMLGAEWAAGTVQITEHLALIPFHPDVYYEDEDPDASFDLTGEVHSYCLVPPLTENMDEVVDFDSGWVTLPVLLVNEPGRIALGLTEVPLPTRDSEEAKDPRHPLPDETN